MHQQAQAAGREREPRVTVLHTRYQSMKNYNYLVVDPGSHRAVIVDPAWELATVERALSDARAVLSGILVTHAHPDHIDLAVPLAERHHCPIWMSNEEIAASGFSAAHLAGIGQRPWSVGQMLIEPILTPGHTPGCTCYLIGDNLFSGDVLFSEGCGMCPDVEAAHAMFASLEHLKARLKPHARIYPGHSYGMSPGRTMTQLRKDNIYLQFSDKQAFAAFRLRSGQSVARMFSFS